MHMSLIKKRAEKYCRHPSKCWSVNVYDTARGELSPSDSAWAMRHCNKQYYYSASSTFHGDFVFAHVLRFRLCNTIFYVQDYVRRLIMRTVFSPFPFTLLLVVNLHTYITRVSIIISCVLRSENIINARLTVNVENTRFFIIFCKIQVHIFQINYIIRFVDIIMIKFYSI